MSAANHAQQARQDLAPCGRASLAVAALSAVAAQRVSDRLTAPFSLARYARVFGMTVATLQGQGALSVGLEFRAEGRAYRVSLGSADDIEAWRLEVFEAATGRLVCRSLGRYLGRLQPGIGGPFRHAEAARLARLWPVGSENGRLQSVLTEAAARVLAYLAKDSRPARFWCGDCEELAALLDQAGYDSRQEFSARLRASPGAGLAWLEVSDEDGQHIASGLPQPLDVLDVAPL